MNTNRQVHSRSTVKSNTAAPRSKNSQRVNKRPVENRAPRRVERSRSYSRNPDFYRSGSEFKDYSRKSYSYGNTSDLYKGSYSRATSTYRGAGGRSTLEYGYSDNSFRGSFSAYNRGSVATDFFYDADIPADIEIDMKNKGKKSRKEQTQAKQYKKVNILRIVASIVVILVLAIMMIVYSAINNSQRQAIDSKQAELASIKAENQHLETTLSEDIDLVKIAKEAEKLGLQKPQAYQITEVQVPNESYTVQYEAKIDTKTKDIWSFIKSLL